MGGDLPVISEQSFRSHQLHEFLTQVHHQPLLHQGNDKLYLGGNPLIFFRMEHCYCSTNQSFERFLLHQFLVDSTHNWISSYKGHNIISIYLQLRQSPLWMSENFIKAIPGKNVSIKSANKININFKTFITREKSFDIIVTYPVIKHEIAQFNLSNKLHV